MQINADGARFLLTNIFTRLSSFISYIFFSELLFPSIIKSVFLLCCRYMYLPLNDANFQRFDFKIDLESYLQRHMPGNTEVIYNRQSLLCGVRKRMSHFLKKNASITNLTYHNSFTVLLRKSYCLPPDFMPKLGNIQ